LARAQIFGKIEVKTRMAKNKEKKTCDSGTKSDWKRTVAVGEEK
jgi:hypothetical protein